MEFDIGEYLKSIYIEMVGTKPTEGGWRANDDTIDKVLAYTAEHYGNKNSCLKAFLSDSMRAYLARFGSPPNTPFFINSHLTAESSLGYLETFKKSVEGVRTSNSLLEGFWGLVRSELIASELEFLEGPLSTRQTDPSLHRPSIWWMIACVQAKRINKASEQWLQGETFSLTHSKYVEVKWLYGFEKEKLRSDKTRRDTLMHHFQIAVREATLSWLSSNRIITCFAKPGGIAFNAENPEHTRLLEKLIGVSVPLDERDQKLRDLACEISKSGESKIDEEPPREYKQLQVVSALFTDTGFMRKYVETSEE